MKAMQKNKMNRNITLIGFLLFFTMINSYGQTILTVNPDTGYQGETLIIELSGQNTHFLQGSQTIWFNQGSSTLYPFQYSINAIDNNNISAAFMLYGAVGLWDVNIENSVDGLITKNNGFEVLASPFQAEITAVEPDTIFEGQNLTISLSGQYTHFLQGTQTIWLSQASSTIYAINVNVVSDTIIETYFSIPCETQEGNWIVNLSNMVDGFLNYDYIYIKESVGIDSVFSTNINCFGENDGTITIEAHGASDLLYSYDTISQYFGYFNNLDTGLYNIIVRNQFNCSDTSETIEISQPDALLIESFAASDTGNLCVGTASVSVDGGSMPYSYLWNDPLNQDSAVAIDLCAGTYIIIVTDSNNCIVQDTIQIDNIVGISKNNTTELVKIFPNPSNSGEFFIENNFMSDNKIYVYNNIGKKVFSQISNSSLIKIDLNEQSNGIYYLQIFGDGKIISKKLILAKE